MSQKEIFLQSEGNAWWLRNAETLDKRKFPDEDPLLLEILKLPGLANRPFRVLEVGCGDGRRLQWLQENLGMECHGIEPSALAVEKARARGINVVTGTADHLPWPDGYFDMVLFGFCLYLCDRNDLFKIASEAHRCLKPTGWVLILDFFAPTETVNAYHHCERVKSYKMDYQKLFTWHPSYQLLSQQVRHHADGSYTDDPREWTAVSVIRRNSHE